MEQVSQALETDSGETGLTGVERERERERTEREREGEPGVETQPVLGEEQVSGEEISRYLEPFSPPTVNTCMHSYIPPKWPNLFEYIHLDAASVS